MLIETKELFNEEILFQAMDRYGIPKSNIKPIGGFDSFVYEYKKGLDQYILKITHDIRRNEDYIMGEIDWLNYLAGRGVSVCKVISSINGKYVEKIPCGNSNFLAIAYEKAMGHEVKESDWNSELFQNWGQLVGQIHAATKEYKLSNPAYRRQEWFQEEQLRANKYLPTSRKDTIDCIESLIERLKQLPKDKDSYGLVHSDLHQKNFFVENGKLFVFDFDDIGYHYFINDIAIILYYAVGWPVKQQDNKTEFAKFFFKHFMKGYQKENKLSSFWFNTILDFIRLRHALMLVLFHQMTNIHTLNQNQLRMLEQHHDEVKNGIPIYSFDFGELL